MKKIFLVLTAVLLTGLLFTSANPSLDGRALVADEGVFPRGYFAKTVGYLPGDSIKVTNPTNGERVDILVIGSLDASDGVAILLSPEAAAALSIKKNSNNLVKLTKRNGTADDVVSGSAVITMGDAGLEVPEEISELQNEIAENVAKAEEVLEEIAEEVAQVEETPQDEIAKEKLEEAIVEAEETLEEIAEEVAQVEEIAEEVAQAEEALEKIDEEEILEEIAEENSLVPEYVELDEIPEDEVEAEIAEALAEEEGEDIQEEEEVAVADEVEPEDVEFIADEEIAEAESEAEAEGDEYDAIVLVPSEVNPPESNEDFAEETSTGDVSYVADYSELDSGKYYVQIAVYSQAENVEEVNGLYGNRYPLVVLEKGDRKTVMVGPFSIDEYGTVLERFKAYGYTDAFVKKIN